VATEHQNLTSQIDGIVSLFTTAHIRNPGQATIFFEGDSLDGSVFSEPNLQQLQLTFVPAIGQKLLVIYETDETLSGRVRGFSDDPAGLPVPGLPPTLEDTLDDLQDQLDDHEGRITTLEAGGAFKEDQKDEIVVAVLGATSFPISKAPVDLADVEVHLEGILMEAADFTIVGTTLTWLSPITLEVGETLTVSYQFIP